MSHVGYIRELSFVFFFLVSARCKTARCCQTGRHSQCLAAWFCFWDKDRWGRWGRSYSLRARRAALRPLTIVGGGRRASDPGHRAGARAVGLLHAPVSGGRPGPCERARALASSPAGTWAGAPRPPYQGVPASPRSARSGSATLATRATTQVPLTLATALQCCLPARTTVPRTLVPLVPASHVKALPEPDSSPLPACMRAAMGCRQ